MEMQRKFSSFKTGQILFIQYGEEWNGLCEILQISSQRGRTGGRTLAVRFLGSTKIFGLSWRDVNLLAAEPMTLEQLQTYFQGQDGTV